MHFVKSNPRAFYCMSDDSMNEGYNEETKIERDVVISYNHALYVCDRSYSNSSLQPTLQWAHEKIGADDR